MKLRLQVCCLVLLAFCSSLACATELEDLDWWETAAFYQIYPRSFMDSDGDGIGDLKGITSKLEYLKELGIGATWFSPIFKSPMVDFGYDISDYYAIQEEYGTMEDFEELLAKAKELDIKIILDLVVNHASNESDWFQQSLNGNETYRDWFIWADPIYDEEGNRQPPNNWISVFRKSAWEYKEERDQYYLHQFSIGQADLNYRNPAVVEEMKNIMRFWLDKGADGFRVDAVYFVYEADPANFGGVYPDEGPSGTIGLGPEDYEYLIHNYTKNLDEVYELVYDMRELHDEYKAKDGYTRVLMTEAYSTIHDIVRYYGDGTRNGSHIPFNFFLIVDLTNTSDARDVKASVDKWMTYKPIEKPANWVIGNHDRPRVATRYSPEQVDGWNMMLLLLPGVSNSYLGEEIGMVNGYVSYEETVDPEGCNQKDEAGWLEKNRDPYRTPFQWSAEANAGFSLGNDTWLPVAEGYETLNVEVESLDAKSHLSIYKNLTTLRQEEAFRLGSLETLAITKYTFAFKRTYEDVSYVIVVNFGTESEEIALTWFDGIENDLEVIMASGDSEKNTGDTVTATAVSVSPKEAFVLKPKLKIKFEPVDKDN